MVQDGGVLSLGWGQEGRETEGAPCPAAPGSSETLRHKIIQSIRNVNNYACPSKQRASWQETKIKSKGQEEGRRTSAGVRNGMCCGKVRCETMGG